MPKLSTKMQRYLKCQTGNFGMMFGLMLIPMTGAIGVAIDVNYANQLKSGLQELADSAALAAASQSANSAIRIQTAKDFVTNANIGGGKLHIVPASTTVTAVDATGVVTVSVTAKMNTTLTNAVLANFNGEKSMEVKVTAIAQGAQLIAGRSTQNPACFLALNSMSVTDVSTVALTVIGNVTVNLDGCNLHSNGSLTVQGNAKITDADCLQAVGTVSVQKANNVHVDCAGGEREGAAIVQDPYKDLPAVAQPAGPCSDWMSGPLKPNICYNNVSYNSSGTLEVWPGNIYIKGSLSINGQANVKTVSNGGLPEGSLIYIKEGDMTINGGADVRLKPQTTGTYKGMTMMQPKENITGFTMNGNNTSAIHGIIHSPGGEAKMNGGTDTATGSCLQVVAKTVRLTGNLKAKSQCQSLGMTDLGTTGVGPLTWTPQVVRLTK